MKRAVQETGGAPSRRKASDSRSNGAGGTRSRTANGKQPGGHELDAAPWTRVEGTLMSTARAVRRAYDRRFRETGVNLGEASVLAHLADGGPLTQVELATRIGTGRANVGLLIDSLERKGHVVRASDPNDRRVWLIQLTDDGESVWKRTAEIDRAIRRQLRAGTSSAERDQLDSLLTRIHANAEIILADTD